MSSEILSLTISAYMPFFLVGPPEVPGVLAVWAAMDRQGRWNTIVILLLDALLQ